ncbi:MAG: hypothetical protein E4H09_00795 [Spirochaetales bacterium]|nr:MAG: hypothetical protein E4H09_00795 [Spirochaetales bacterium]
MSDIQSMIRNDIEVDDGIHIKALGIEAFKKGILPRKSYLRLVGIANTPHDRTRAEQIAQHHCGDAYTIIDDIKVNTEK